MVKLRLAPEDFLVTELGGPTPERGEDWEKCEHRLYRLEKKGHDTISLLARLSRELNLPRRSFGLSGLKDRHAVTSQLVSLPVGKGKGLPTEIDEMIGDESAELVESGWRLTLLGGSDEKLRSGSHSANHFRIIVRDITREQVDRLPRRLEQANIHGWPNWFDSQRFGSAVGNRLPGADIVAGEYEAAMHLHLTMRNKSDRSDRRRDKKKMDAAWPEIGNLSLEHRPHTKLIKAYNRATQRGLTGEKLWHHVYMAMPYDIRGLWLSAWQSERWNMLIADLLHENFPLHLMREVEIGAGGPLYFPEVPSGKRGKPKRTLVTRIAKILETLPKTLQLPHSEIDLSEIDQYLSDHQRETLVCTAVSASEPENDEMRKRKGKRWKVTLDFELPPGAYATVLVKRLFH